MLTAGRIGRRSTRLGRSRARLQMAAAYPTYVKNSRANDARRTPFATVWKDTMPGGGARAAIAGGGIRSGGGVQAVEPAASGRPVIAPAIAAMSAPRSR